MKKLILFDIDGTLIDPGKAGRDSVTQAFYELFSIKDAFSGIKMAGRTDIQIIKEALSIHGLSSGHGIISSILARYVKILKTKANLRRMKLKHGVYDLLNALETQNGHWIGLLTGNIEQGARIKLGTFDLNRYFPFGAFCDDNEDRNQLLPVAVEKFRKIKNMDIQYRDCVVIGDTPMDVECSHPFGATSIAVSTGPYSYETLLETGADYVIRDLSNAMELIMTEKHYA